MRSRVCHARYGLVTGTLRRASGPLAGFLVVFFVLLFGTHAKYARTGVMAWRNAAHMNMMGMVWCRLRAGTHVGVRHAVAQFPQSNHFSTDPTAVTGASTHAHVCPPPRVASCMLLCGMMADADAVLCASHRWATLISTIWWRPNG